MQGCERKRVREDWESSLPNLRTNARGKNYLHHGSAYLTTPSFQVPQLPKASEIGFVTIHYYNKAVKSTIRFVEMVPCYAGQGIKYVSDSVKKAMDTPAQS